MTIDPYQIACLVQETFRGLPSKRKPQIRDNGLHEWVPLSGIVAEQNGNLRCLALATGMKCLPTEKIPLAKGNAIHDWHAEVLILRALNHLLLSECQRLICDPGAESELLCRRAEQPCASITLESDGDIAYEDKPFALRDDIRLHMYCSEAPCGDSSMELVMEAQEDPSPWQVPTSDNRQNESKTEGPETTSSGSSTVLLGRGFFSELGVVRRKPARGDAPPTMSKSCSDKLALKQCLSVLSSLAALFIHPRNAYLTSLTLPNSQYSMVACDRAFSAEGRLKSLAGKSWAGGLSFVPFQLQTTSREFEFSRRTVQLRSNKIATSNLAAAWHVAGLNEGLIGGVLQGRRAFDIRGASLVSRRKMWALARDIVSLLDGERWASLQAQIREPTYRDVKAGKLLMSRRDAAEHVKREALAGWIPNCRDDTFMLE